HHNLRTQPFDHVQSLSHLPERIFTFQLRENYPKSVLP
ncbi:MAG: hypothetical protein JWP47_910, partial [Polaromonas sp.]|nr:hypothetical protein [Polaromonas sp.]